MVFTKQIILVSIFVFVALCDRKVQGLPFGQQPVKLFGTILDGGKNSSPLGLPNQGLLPMDGLSQLGRPGNTPGLDSLTSSLKDPMSGLSGLTGGGGGTQGLGALNTAQQGLGQLGGSALSGAGFPASLSG